MGKLYLLSATVFLYNVKSIEGKVGFFHKTVQ